MYTHTRYFFPECVIQTAEKYCDQKYTQGSVSCCTLPV